MDGISVLRIKFHQAVSLMREMLEKTGKDTSYSLRAYRYGSWFMTSLFYLVGQPHASVFFKVGVIVSLLLAVKPVLWLYEEFRGIRSNIFKMVLIETVGIALLLIPTGGLSSPFIWYALNPVLVAISFLPFYKCCVNLVLYLILCLFTSASAYGQNLGIDAIRSLVTNNSSTLLVFLLITFAFKLHVRLAAYLQRQAQILERNRCELLEVNSRLAAANGVIREYTNNLIALYSSVEAFCSHDDREELMELFTHYTSVLTGGLDAAFRIWSEDYENPRWDYFKVSGEVETRNAELIRKKLYSLSRDTLVTQVKPKEIIIDESEPGSVLVYMPVRSASRCFGVICVMYDSPFNDESQVILQQRLDFLARFSAAIFERIRLEEMADVQILTDEQNRIAEEIHDTVSQRLFSISFALHSLSGRCGKLSASELTEELKFIQKSSNKAAKELTSSIYKLSSRKNGSRALAQSISTYLSEFARLNNIEVFFEADKMEDLLCSEIKIALYRIAREATANAIKHGKCTVIDVNLSIARAAASLTISDNGTGFELADVGKEGLGLGNMRKLVKAVNGHIEITSSPGAGTILKCQVPLGQGALTGSRGDTIESCLG